MGSNIFRTNNNSKVLVLNNSFNNLNLYPLKQLTNNLSGVTYTENSNVKLSATSENKLTSILDNGIKQFRSLSNNKVCNSITLDQKAFKVDFFKEKFSVDDINFEATYDKQRGRQVTNPNTDVEYNNFKNNLINELRINGTLLTVEPKSEVPITIGNLYYYVLDKEVETSKNINGQIIQKYKEESERLNQVLKDKVRTNGNVSDLQFRPTVRNVVGTIMASVDAFYQLMDDVHTNAWNQRETTARLKSIITTNPSQEGKNVIQTTTTKNPNYLFTHGHNSFRKRNIW